MHEKQLAFMNKEQFTLNPDLLYAAYSQGYFPMPDNESGEILWFKPNPRAIIPLDNFHVSRSLKKKIKKNIFNITYSQNFLAVINACANHNETWINNEIITVYTQLYYLGLAHSVEVWCEGELVGGTYGVCIGGAFFAESKFHRKTDASKIALYYLVERMRERGFKLLECQFLTPHLESLGAKEISDQEYMSKLGEALKEKCVFA